MTAPLLDATTLAGMRALQESNMPSTCDLIGFAETRLAGGSPKRTPVLIVGGVKCRLLNMSASLPLRAEQLMPVASYLLILPADTDTESAARAVVRGTTAGVAWEVELELVGEQEPRSYSASRRLLANLATTSLPMTSVIATVEVYEA